jgi:hypothetical protein
METTAFVNVSGGGAGLINSSLRRRQRGTTESDRVNTQVVSTSIWIGNAAVISLIASNGDGGAIDHHIAARQFELLRIRSVA